MKKIIKTLFAFMLVLILCNPLLSGQNIFAASRNNGILLQDDFTNNFDSNVWTKDGEGSFDVEYNQVSQPLINSVYFDSDVINSVNAQATYQTSSALYSTRQFSGDYTVKFGIHLKKGAFELVLGATSNNIIESIDGLKFDFTSTGISFNKGVEESYGSGINILNRDVSFIIEVNTDNIIVQMIDDGNAIFSKTYTKELNTDGYLGFIFSKANAGTGHILDVLISDTQNVTIVYDSFMDEATVAHFGESNLEFYLWKSLTEDNAKGQYGLRVATSNEFHIINSGWPNELLYTDYELQGGIGKKYTIQFDLTLGNGFFGFVPNAKRNDKGLYQNNINTIVGDVQTLPSFDSGSIKIVSFSNDGITAPVDSTVVSYMQNRKMNVAITLEQTEIAKTNARITFTYANDITRTSYFKDYTISRAIGGYVGFHFGAETRFSNFSIFDENNNYVARDDFSKNNILETIDSKNYLSNWYMSLSKNNASNKLLLYDFGNYNSDSKLIINSNQKSGLALISNKSVPARQAIIDTREIMFISELTIKAEKLTSNNSLNFLFGIDEANANGVAQKLSQLNRVAVSQQSIDIYQGGTLIKSQTFDSIKENEYILKFVGKSNGILEVYADDVLLCDANYGLNNDDIFVGKLGILSLNESNEALKINLNAFIVELTGIPSVPTLIINKPAYLTVGESIDLTPSVMSDEIDTAEDLSLLITVTNLSTNEEIAVTNNKVTLPSADYYRIEYVLTNKATLTASDSFIARGIYRGNNEKSLDVIRSDFAETDENWSYNNALVTNDKVSINKNGELMSIETAMHFIMMIDIDTVRTDANGSLEIIFGNCYDYNHSFGIIFNNNNTVTLRNLFSENGTRNITLSRDINLYNSENTTTLKIMVMGSQITVFAKSENEPYDFLYKAIMTAYFENDMPATYGQLGVKTGGDTSLNLSNAQIFSLNSYIDIETEEYDPSIDADKQGRGLKPLLNAGMQLYEVILIVAGIILGMAAATIVILVLIKKNGKQMKGDKKQ